MEFEKRLLSNSYWLSRIFFIKFLGFVTFIAFLVAFMQNNALIGPNGLTPAEPLLTQRKEKIMTNWNKYLYETPTLFWFIPVSDLNLSIISFIGMIVSIIIIINGQSNVFLYSIQWILYLSIVNVGNVWYRFGWESHLLEQLFLASLIVPIISLQKFPKWTPTPILGVYANMWLLFRIMIGKNK